MAGLATPLSLQGPSVELAATHYQCWLDEDVPYIVIREERAMFARLTTDKDRERLVQEFWERRNPKPGSADNASEREYHVRLGHAQRHFHYLAERTRGDRARFYILYGPPDKLDQATPQNQKLTGIKETWICNRLEGIDDHIAVQFEGTRGSSEYHVVTDPESLRGPSA